MPHSLLTKLVYRELPVTMHLRQLANEIKILRMQKMEDRSSGHYNPARVTTECYLSCTAMTSLKSTEMYGLYCHS